MKNINEIMALTGCYERPPFKSEEEIYNYFSIGHIESMFGRNYYDFETVFTKKDMINCAKFIITNKLHCSF